MTADMEQALGKFIGEQNPFTEMRLPPDWQTDETIVTFPSVTDFWRTWPMERLLEAWRAAGIDNVRQRPMTLGGGIVIWGRRA